MFVRNHDLAGTHRIRKTFASLPLPTASANVDRTRAKIIRNLLLDTKTRNKPKMVAADTRPAEPLERFTPQPPPIRVDHTRITLTSPSPGPSPIPDIISHGSQRSAIRVHLRVGRLGSVIDALIQSIAGFDRLILRPLRYLRFEENVLYATGFLIRYLTGRIGKISMVKG